MKKSQKINELDDLLEIATKELTFSNTCQEHLRSIIYEVEKLTKDETIKMIIGNGLDRHNLDKIKPS